MGTDNLKSKNTSETESTDQQTRAGGPDCVRSEDIKTAEPKAAEASMPPDGLRDGGRETVRSVNPKDKQET